VQDVQARQTELRAGFASRSQIVAESGESAEEIDDQNVADKERANALGLKYETHCQAPEMEPESCETCQLENFSSASSRAPLAKGCRCLCNCSSSSLALR
jgi:capsid protein